MVLGLVIAPLHAFALPRAVLNAPSSDRFSAAPATHTFLPPRGWPFILLAAAFACHAFLISGVTSNLLAMLERGGIDTATVVVIGALFGPAQVLARLGDFALASRTSPLWVARVAVICMVFGFAVLALAGISVVVAGLFCILFGAANGVMTIARGALPLAMFGPAGYGRVIGRIARPALLLQASAPFTVAAIAQRLSDETVLELGAIGALVALGCLLALRLPPRRHGDKSVDLLWRSTKHRIDIVLRSVIGIAIELRAIEQACIADAVVDDGGGMRLDGIDAAPDIHHDVDVMLDEFHRIHHLVDALSGQILKIAGFENRDHTILNVLAQSVLLIG